MARIRTIKPELWADEKVGSIDMGARLLFIGMINFADDDGVVSSNPIYLKSQIFPYDEALRLSAVKGWLDALVKARILVPLSFEGQNYYVIRTFRSHQVISHPAKGKIPSVVIDSVLSGNTPELSSNPPESSSNTPELSSNPPSGKERKGKEGKGKESIGQPAAPEFDFSEQNFETFWKEYPRRVNKKKAKEAFLKINPDPILFVTILEAIRKQADTVWKGKAIEYIPHPTTWLNGRRWEDEIQASPSPLSIGSHSQQPTPTRPAETEEQEILNGIAKYQRIATERALTELEAQIVKNLNRALEELKEKAS